MRKWIALPVLLWAFLAAGLQLPPALAQPRPFPDSAGKILIFADQFPTPQMPEAQIKFVASHYVGTQKMPPSFIRRVRALNPGFLLLHYQLAVGNGPAAFQVGEKWINDFAEVKTHEDWFMHADDGTTRLRQPAWDWYLMNIAFKGDRPATDYPAYWVNAAVSRMRANEANGTFADSYTQDILMGQLQPKSKLTVDVNEMKTRWLPQLNKFGAYCTAEFHQQPEHFYYLPNLGGLVTTWDRVTDLAVGDGGMNEGFCAEGPGRYFSDDDWKLAMTRLLSLAAKDKIIICQTAVDPANADHRWFLIGSFLLVKGHHFYLNLINKSSLEWYPEYNLPLGKFCDEPGNGHSPPDVMHYWDADKKVFVRQYEHGTVYVNPFAAAVTVDLPGGGRGERLPVVHGGGTVPENGQEPGMLDYQPAPANLLIPGHSARVVIRAGW